MPKHPSAGPTFFWVGQPLHAIGLVLLLGATWLAVDLDQTDERRVAGIGVTGWFLISLAIPVVHQVFVWLIWRGELCFGWPTKTFGTRAFGTYRFLFFVLFLARPITLILLAIADHDSIALSIPIRVVACTILGLPAIYAGYSVIRYFGLSRAAGADHFDITYRDLPLVNQGTFKYTSNSMYTFAFLGFWAIGVAAASWLAIVVAAFSHAYIWLHYFCTERPDMDLIYGSGEG